MIKLFLSKYYLVKQNPISTQTAEGFPNFDACHNFILK